MGKFRIYIQWYLVLLLISSYSIASSFTERDDKGVRVMHVSGDGIGVAVNRGNINVHHTHTHQGQISEEERYTTFIQQAMSLQSATLDDGRSKNILVLGKTGVGKSALVTYLTGHSLVTAKGKKLKRGSESNFNIEIGDGPTSKTRVPSQARDVDTGIHYWDCPGFFDTKGDEQEIFNAMAINQLANQGALKILFCVNYSELENRWDSCIESLERIMSIFQDHRMLENCLSLVITQIDQDIIEEVEADLYPVAQEAELRTQFKPETLALMKSLLKSKRSFFPKPRAGIGASYDTAIKGPIRSSIERTLYVNWQGKARLAIGRNAAGFIDKLHDYYNRRLINLIRDNKDRIPSDPIIHNKFVFVSKSQDLIKFHQLRIKEECKNKEGFMKHMLPLLPSEISNSIQDASKIFAALRFLKPSIHIDAERLITELHSVDVPKQVKQLIQNLNLVVEPRLGYEKTLKPFMDQKLTLALNHYRTSKNYDQFQPLLGKLIEFSELRKQKPITSVEYFKRLNGIFEDIVAPDLLDAINALDLYNPGAAIPVLNKWQEKLNGADFSSAIATALGQTIVPTIAEWVRNPGIGLLRSRLDRAKPEIRAGKKYEETKTFVQKLDLLQKPTQRFDHNQIKKELLDIFNSEAILVKGIDLVDQIRAHEIKVGLSAQQFNGIFSELELVSFLLEMSNLNKEYVAAEQKKAEEKKRAEAAAAAARNNTVTYTYREQQPQRQVYTTNDPSLIGFCNQMNGRW